MSTKQNLASISDIARKLCIEQDTARKWLDAEGLRPVKESKTRKEYDLEAALEAIKPHVKSKVVRNYDPTANIDPESGLTWQQKKIKEEARSLEMENDRAAKLLSEEIMLTSDHHKILAAIVSRLEQVPGKAQSELGLNSPQIIGLRRMLDEARVSAAKAIVDDTD